MARKNRHNTAFVVGAVAGGLAGAAAALWKTPYAGEELRAKVGLGETHTLADDTMRITPEGEMRTLTTSSTGDGGRSFKDKLLSTVENTLAPIVGVELGKTANDGGAVATQGGVTSHAAHADTTSMGPGAGRRPAGSAPGEANRDHTGEPPAYPRDDDDDRRDAGQVPKENVTPVDRDGGDASDLSPATTTTGANEEDAASIEDLTRPQTDLVPEAFQEEEGEMKPFPKLGGLENDPR